jgi:tetratricopeptide (TPR) repeat protein
MRWPLVLVLVAASAHAQPAPAGPPPVDREAEELYKHGRYAEAAHRFEEAYALDPRPAYLFNTAQSYRLAGQCANAAAAYRKFLDVAPKDTPNLEKVDAYVRDMDDCVKAQAPMTVAPPAPRPPEPLPVMTPPPEVHGSALPAIGIGVGIAGLAVIGAGVYFQHEVSVAENERAACTMAAPCTLSQLKAIDDRGNSNSTRAIASYSIGAAAVVTGVVLIVIGKKHAAAERVSVAPLPGGAFAGVTYGF